MLSPQGSFRLECVPYFLIAWPPFRAFNLSDSMLGKQPGYMLCGRDQLNLDAERTNDHTSVTTL
jgi:hypothetical protein